MTRKEIGEAEEDDDWFNDEMSTSGGSILTVGWDSAMSGGSGTVDLIEWRNLYFCRCSDADPVGPFATPDDGLSCDYLGSLSSNNEIWSKSIPLRRLLKFAADNYVDAEGGTIRVNDRTYVLKNGKFVPDRS